MLKLVAGNFYQGENQPCIDPYLASVDKPVYVQKASLAAIRTESKFRNVQIREEILRKHLDDEDADERGELTDTDGKKLSLKLTL